MLLGSNAQPKIIAIGDSITKGYPDDYSWVPVVSKRLEIDIENLGVNGDTFAGILMRIDKDVVPKEPDLCIISAGTNDIFLGYEVAEIKKTIKQIIITLEREGIIPIITTPIPTIDEYSEKKLSELRQWIQAVCPHTIPFHKVFIDESLISGALLGDGVHPTHEGHDKLAEVAMTELRKILIDILK
jgi:lysophospholipase L1-like esterase